MSLDLYYHIVGVKEILAVLVVYPGVGVVISAFILFAYHYHVLDSIYHLVVFVTSVEFIGHYIFGLE